MTKNFSYRSPKIMWVGALMFIMMLTIDAPAQQAGLHIVRDAEIETDLRRMMTPIMDIAGLDPDAVRFILVQDSTLNAFVAGGMNVFIHTGLIQKTDTPDALIGVLAHELGHVAGGHLVRGTEALRNASYEAILGMVAGLAVGVLSRNSQAAVATLGGAQELAQRSFFSFSRSQEGSADAAAMRFLDGANWSANGLLGFMRQLQNEDYLPTSSQSQYVRTHPLTQDRIAAVAHHVEQQTSRGRVHAVPAPFIELHARIKAKLLGYLQPESALLRFSPNDSGLAARYARSIALYRSNRFAEALTVLNGLIAANPDDPFFHELHGQILYETGRIPESVTAYQTAVRLLPNSALLEAALGQSLIQSNMPGATAEAVVHLEHSAHLEPQVPATWRSLATAWGRQAETGMTDRRGLADYALAEEALANDNKPDARQLAERALKIMPADSPYRLRAQDITALKNDSQ